ncbi:TIGR01777 family oxidoreductase [Psychromonas antarctica]|uniref:TIGR01777 family oxidoreductase n=1 Tax=Psychromonas antarctica TaxID=67573 RepID=UPI001EE8B8B9|nr:TIGR01777 family oxidoreductase [Psychromonas antarctica]MCG6200734.1 TIGR01777 family oxidoreductase [Psychromonas antarctica]
MNNKTVLISGSSGLIGSALVPFLEKKGFIVGRLLRKPQAQHPYWDINNKSLQLKAFANPDVVINLAGESIASGRWTRRKKQQLIDSRISSTKLLVDHFQTVSPPPKLFINASAIGFYGDKGQQQVTENAPVGKDFVSQLACQWEQVAEGIKSTDTRLVNLRTGIVMSKEGGALAKMLPAFKLGLGGRIGSGQQIMSWIDINDLLEAIFFIIETPQIQGPVNLVSPNPISNRQFSQLLATQLKRPCLLPLPAFLVKLLFAQMGKELLLSSTNVFPRKLIDAQFKFEYEKLQQSLAKQLS